MDQKEKRLKKWLVGNLNKYKTGEAVFIEPGYGSTDGLPDCIVLLSDGGMLFIELKATQDSPVRRSQQKMRDKFFKYGFYIYKMFWEDDKETRVSIERNVGASNYCFSMTKFGNFFKCVTIIDLKI